MLSLMKAHSFAKIARDRTGSASAWRAEREKFSSSLRVAHTGKNCAVRANVSLVRSSALF